MILLQTLDFSDVATFQNTVHTGVKISMCGSEFKDFGTFVVEQFLFAQR